MSLKLLELNLSNFNQFKNKTVALDDSTVVIVGANGSGKTTLLEAIFFALTGEFRNGSKQDYLTDLGTSKKADKGFVELKFTYGGTAGVIKRMLHTSGCTLSFGDTKLTKANEVNDFMTSLLGVTKKVFGKHCYVAQGETESIVSDQPSLRAEMFTELFGSQHCKRIYDILGKAESAIAVTDYSALILEKQVKIDAARTAIEGVTAELATVRAERASLPDREKLKTLIDAHAVASTLRGSLDTAQADLGVAITEVNGLNTTVEDLTKSLGQHAAVRDSLKSGYISAKENLKKLRDNKTLNASLFNFSSILANTKDTAAELAKDLEDLKAPACTVDLDKLGELADAVKYHSRVVEHYKSHFKTGEVLKCPTCDQVVPTDKLETAKQFLAANLDRLRNWSSTAANERVAVDTYNARKLQLQTLLADKENAVLAQTAELRKIERSLHDLSLPTESEDNLLKLVTEYDANESELAVVSAQLLAAKANLNGASKRLDKLIKVVEDLAERLQSAPSDQEFLSAKQVLDRHERLTASEHQLTGLLTGNTRELSSLESELDRLGKLQADSDRVKAYKELISKARNVMHRDNLPRIRAQRYTDAINERLQLYLNRFDSKFTAALTAEYDFSCVFPDGKTQRSARLSGGEKVRLSLAFRFAVNELFANNLGLLILDEPTAFLDDDNIGFLADIFEQMRQTAKNSDMQVIVVTHEKNFIGHFDKVVDLNASRGI